MVHPTDDDEADYFYLRYATLGQFFKGLKTAVIWWVASSVGLVILHFIGEAVKTVVDLQSFEEPIPHRFWLWVYIALFSWILSGVTLPKLGVLGWVLFNVWIGGSFVADALLHSGTVRGVLFFGLCFFGQFFLETVAIGKANYEAVMLKAEANSGLLV